MADLSEDVAADESLALDGEMLVDVTRTRRIGPRLMQFGARRIGPRKIQGD